MNRTDESADEPRRHGLGGEMHPSINDGPVRRSPWTAIGVACFTIAMLGATAPTAVARDIEKVEAVGAAPIYPGGAAQQVLRDRAVRSALNDAVRKSAARLLGVVEPQDPERFESALGSDPYPFVSRFHVVEDRGVQPALFSSNPEVESEYRVIVEVDIDRDRVRGRLVANQLLGAPSGVVSSFQTRIALEGLEDYRDYEAIRSALVTGAGARSATLIEAMPGRIVIAVDSDRGGSELLSALERSIPGHLELIPLQVDPDLLRLRVTNRNPGGLGSTGHSSLHSPSHPPSQPNAELGEFDTTERNRY